MTPIDTTNDRKLLIVVAGFVVAGAVGLAILAGLRADRTASAGDSTPRITSTTQRREFPAPAMPASRPRTPVPVTEPSADPIDPIETAVAIAATPAKDEGAGTTDVRIEADADPVKVGIASYQGREFAKAAAHFAAAVEIRPQDGWLQYMLGLSLWKDGQLDEAASAMESAAKADPDSIKTLINLSRISNDAGSYESALRAAQAAVEIAPGDAVARFLEGRSLYNLERMAEAEAALRHSVTMDDGNGYVHNLLGLVLLETDRSGEAVAAFTRASQIEPGVGYVWNNLGMALEHDGARAEAVSAYRKATECDPGHSRAAANLARLEPQPVPEEEAGVVVADASTTE